MFCVCWIVTTPGRAMEPVCVTLTNDLFELLARRIPGIFLLTNNLTILAYFSKSIANKNKMAKYGKIRTVGLIHPG